jgi:hypothetical protein
MSTDAFSEKGQRMQGGTPPDGWRPGDETAPSVLREDDLRVPRLLGGIGVTLVLIGSMALFFNLTRPPEQVRVGLGWTIILLTLGLCGMLIHAAFERDAQYRLAYLALGLALLLAGAGFFIAQHWYGGLLAWGVLFLALALLFLLGFLRNTHEPFAPGTSDPFLRNLAEFGLGIGGAVMAVIGLGAGMIQVQFLMTYGLLLSLIGLVYLLCFAANRGARDDLGHNTGWAVAGLGLLVVAIALIRTLINPSGPFFIPQGFSLLLLGCTYIVAGLAMSLDSSLVVLTRRELGAFFYSPMAYLCLFGFVVFSWVTYIFFIGQLQDVNSGPSFEPILQYYYYGLFPVFVSCFVVPVLTMRMLSEEQRSGTMEVLLTAPVDEVTVVLSKFLAALVTYMVMWLPYGLLLLAIPLSGGNAFDYRPMLGFLVGVLVTGAAFVSMGLFFSSLTDNQVVSGVLTFAGMLGLLAISLFAFQARGRAGMESGPGNILGLVLTHMSYLHLWLRCLEGRMIPRYFLFPLSLTVLWLFLTVKVLESRKWR